MQRLLKNNDFHGGEFGFLTSVEQGRWQLDVATRLGIGQLTRRLLIDGQTFVQTPTGSQATSTGGLLALASNIGRYDDNTFALLPELDLKVRLLLTERLSATVGYNLLFLTNVYRTGPQIDRTIDTQQLSEALPVNGGLPGAQNHPAARLDAGARERGDCS